MARANIDENITIEELVSQYPSSVKFLMLREIKYLVCGEPIWGTLAEAAPEKGDATADLPSLISDLKRCLGKGSN